LPFTIAHAAIVLPCQTVAGKRLITSGLVVGSMIPDAEYMLRLRATGKFAHSLRGLFLFCLPVGVVTTWVLESLIGPELRFMIKAPAEGEHPDQAAFKVRLLLTAISVLVGSATHVFWDHPTHDWGWPVKRWSGLRALVPVPLLGAQPLYACLQHLSGCAGLAVLAIWQRGAIVSIRDGVVGSDALSSRRRLYWLLLAASGTLGAALNALSCRWRQPGGCSVRRAVSYAAVGSMAATALGAISLASLSRIWRVTAPWGDSTFPQPGTGTNSTHHAL
jgi:hypothetical protein